MKPTLGSIANADSAVSSDKPRNRKRRKAVPQRFYLLGVRLDHDVAVDEDRADDRAREQRMCEHVDGDPVSGSGSGSLTMLGAYLLIG